jgi:transposase InsO family protein
MIEEEEGTLAVRAMCRALKVSPSAYYDWRSRPASAREVEDRRLAVEVRAVHRESRQTYGARRIHAELQDRGVACGRHRVARLMREHGLVARGPKRKPPKATPEAPLTPVAENVLDRAFEPEGPDRVWRPGLGRRHHARRDG